MPMIVFCSIIRQMQRICEKKRKQIYENSASCFPQLADSSPDACLWTQKQAMPMPSYFRSAAQPILPVNFIYNSL